MPLVSLLFLVGALAICGLPLFNGFISEFIIYFGLFQGLFHLPLQGSFACALGIIALALMGSLALACFTKVYGTVFLGEPRHLKGQDWKNFIVDAFSYAGPGRIMYVDRPFPSNDGEGSFFRRGLFITHGPFKP